MSDESKATIAEWEKIVDAWIEEKHIYQMLPLDAPGYVRQALIGAFVHGYLLGAQKNSTQTDEAISLAKKFSEMATKAIDEGGLRRLWKGI